MVKDEFIDTLIERLFWEFKKKDYNGVYALIQRELAYNSNRIEGNGLTKEQTVSLFETNTLGVLATSGNEKIDDVNEMKAHFLLFNYMLQTYQKPLTSEIIKKYHFYLKYGCFNDFEKGYGIGEFKTRENTIGGKLTVAPQKVPIYIDELLSWYENKENKTLKDLAELHCQYESIHPFQDGNGRTGRIILFKECLRQRIVPFIVQDKNKSEYYDALRCYAHTGDTEPLMCYFAKEQKEFIENTYGFLFPVNLEKFEQCKKQLLEESKDSINKTKEKTK